MIKVLTKREKTILYTTMGVIISAVLFNFLLAPILSKNANLNREINLTRTKIKKYLRLLSQKDAIQSKYGKFSSGLKAAGQEADPSVAALSELENLAKNAKIRIIDIRPQSAKGSSLYKEIPIDLKAEGTMEGYLKFIYDLENSLLLMRIKKFQLNAKPAAATLEGIFSISQIMPSSS